MSSCSSPDTSPPGPVGTSPKHPDRVSSRMAPEYRATAAKPREVTFGQNARLSATRFRMPMATAMSAASVTWAQSGRLSTWQYCTRGLRRESVASVTTEGRREQSIVSQSSGRRRRRRKV
eukprot:Amastigsp_a512701_4.p2 type:complete len:120 gc:universal Amastigsp_a512701_4:327-686(+)